jgi:hypothetical protein
MQMDGEIVRFSCTFGMGSYRVSKEWRKVEGVQIDGVTRESMVYGSDVV